MKLPKPPQLAVRRLATDGLDQVNYLNFRRGVGT